MHETEFIPDSDRLYYRVNKKKYHQIKRSRRINRDHRFPISLFSFGGCYLSSDWSKYSTPREAQGRAKIPEDNGIVEFKVGHVRREQHKVYHTPCETNHAHSAIFGIKPKVQLTLQRIAKWSEGFVVPEE